MSHGKKLLGQGFYVKKWSSLGRGYLQYYFTHIPLCGPWPSPIIPVLGSLVTTKWPRALVLQSETFVKKKKKKRKKCNLKIEQANCDLDQQEICHITMKHPSSSLLAKPKKDRPGTAELQADRNDATASANDGLRRASTCAHIRIYIQPIWAI